MALKTRFFFIRNLTLLIVSICCYACKPDPNKYEFSQSLLKNASIQNPTSLQFGPDGRLYVSQQDGTIKIFTVRKDGHDDYTVIRTEIIESVKNIPNHDDNGLINPAIKKRQVTGILVKGTAGAPIIYVTSSDSRIGGPQGGDIGLDTNSGIISELHWNGKSWTKVDLVKGLPRAEEDHSVNGMQLDEKTNTLYVTVGSNTNAGAPSKNMGYTCEYALSASIISVDLKKIDSMPTSGNGDSAYKYILPTLDDPTRENIAVGEDVNDPFGGNDGLNQAKIVEGGPVKIFATGFRNPYDFLITKDRNMYTIDNGPNSHFGGYPDKEGTAGVTNNYLPGEPGSTMPTSTEDTAYQLDGLEFIGNMDTYKPGSYYGGHPNPVRANPQGAGLFVHDGNKGVWRTGSDSSNPLPKDWPPVASADSIESDYQAAGINDKSLVTFFYSTNGLAEYTASNFNSSLKGVLLATNFDNGNIYKINLSANGEKVTNAVNGKNKYMDEKPFASNVGIYPLDIVAQGDGDIFPGTIWVAGYASSNIIILEPTDAVDCMTDKGCWKYLTPEMDAKMSREENAYVAVGNNFYLMGGRGIQPIMMFNSSKNTWTEKAKPPMELHHFQAFAIDSLIYIMGAFTGDYPHEKPVPDIYLYNTKNDRWSVGPPMPPGRLRGAAGAVVYNGKIYIVAGMIDGHFSGGVTWFDEYDPVLNTWKVLPDAPRARDHCHAAVIGHKLYLAGGRLSSHAKQIPEVDVYDFLSGKWETLPKESNIPTPRAGTATAVMGNELIIIGGETDLPKALKNVEALNVENNTWRKLTDLQTGRHGTQAIVKDNGIFIVTGAGDQGGSNLLNSQEFFYIPPPVK